MTEHDHGDVVWHVTDEDVEKWAASQLAAHPIMTWYVLWRPAGYRGKASDHNHWSGPFETETEARQAAAALPAKRRELVAVVVPALRR
jgi:hypothetical protein